MSGVKKVYWDAAIFITWLKKEDKGPGVLEEIKVRVSTKIEGAFITIFEGHLVTI